MAYVVMWIRVNRRFTVCRLVRLANLATILVGVGRPFVDFALSASAGFWVRNASRTGLDLGLWECGPRFCVASRYWATGVVGQYLCMSNIVLVAPRDLETEDR